MEKLSSFDREKLQFLCQYRGISKSMAACGYRYTLLARSVPIRYTHAELSIARALQPTPPPQSDPKRP